MFIRGLKFFVFSNKIYLTGSLRAPYFNDSRDVKEQFLLKTCKTYCGVEFFNELGIRYSCLQKFAVLFRCPCYVKPQYSRKMR